MPQRRVLFLDAACLVAYRVGGGTLEAEGRFTPDETGLQAFADYLQRHAGSLFLLLVDVAEEGFQLEDIPYSTGKDRQAILKRKLAQYFYGTPLTIAQSLGRLKTGRRDERLLLMALTRPPFFEPWLATLRATRSILAGIWSLPQVVGQLLPADAPSQLLLITQSGGGLRQTYFVDRQLRFSRLSPLATGSADELALAAALEAIKMHQYLSGQRLVERGKPLATRVLVHPAQAAAMRARCRDNAELRFECVDLLQEAGRAGLHSPLEDSRAELLFCHLLAKKPPADQFAPPTERQFHRLWQTRYALKGTSAVIFAGCLLFVANIGLELLQHREDIDRLRQESLRDQQSYNAALQALPKIPLTTDNLRALIDRYDQVAKRAEGPAPLLAQLSRSLDAFPQIEIDQIEWRIIEQLDAPPATAGLAPVPPELANGPYAQAIVAARLPLAMVGDHRGQLTLVAEFVKHLGGAPATQAVVLHPPVDTQSGKTLKSGDVKNTPEAPKFSFRLTHKL